MIDGLSRWWTLELRWYGGKTTGCRSCVAANSGAVGCDAISARTPQKWLEGQRFPSGGFGVHRRMLGRLVAFDGL